MPGLRNDSFRPRNSCRGNPYRGLQYALGSARERGADLLILGKVPYFYAGHTVDDTAITLQIDIYSCPPAPCSGP